MVCPQLMCTFCCHRHLESDLLSVFADQFGSAWGFADGYDISQPVSATLIRLPLAPASRAAGSWELLIVAAGVCGHGASPCSVFECPNGC